MATALVPLQDNNHSLHHKIAAAVIAGIEAAINRRDFAAVASRFARTAIWTNALGTRIIGHTEIESAGEGLLPLMAEGDIRCEVVGVTQLRPGLLAVSVIHHASDQNRPRRPDADTCALYLIGREADGWRVLAGQATIHNEIE